jgi:hypothetical protein
MIAAVAERKDIAARCKGVLGFVETLYNEHNPVVQKTPQYILLQRVAGAGIYHAKLLRKQ